MPGSLKNLLDWTVGGIETIDKPAAWINISTTSGATKTHDSLTTVLTYTGTKMVDAACVRIPVHRDAVGASGLIEDATVRAEIRAAVTKLLAAT
jgi:chromate reductase